MASGNCDSNHARKPLMPMRIVDDLEVDLLMDDEGVVVVVDVKRVFQKGEANGTRLLCSVATVDLNLLWKGLIKAVLEKASAVQ